MSPEDSELVIQSRNGVTAAYAVLVGRYEKTARVVAMRYLTDHHSVEDAVQQAFLIGFEGLGSLRKPNSFRAWILRIVQREAQAYARSRAKTIELGTMPEPAANLDEDDTYSVHETVDLLNRLPDHERIVITLHYLDGHSTSEIARMLARPVGTVTKQMSRAINRLQQFVLQRERIHGQ